MVLTKNYVLDFLKKFVFIDLSTVFGAILVEGQTLQGLQQTYGKIESLMLDNSRKVDIQDILQFL